MDTPKPSSIVPPPPVIKEVSKALPTATPVIKKLPPPIVPIAKAPIIPVPAKEAPAPIIVPTKELPPPDTDRDGIPDIRDNCPLIPNPGQRDTDGNGK